MGTDSMALKAPPRQPALWCTKGGSRTGFPPCSLRMAHGGRAPRWERSTSSGEPRRFPNGPSAAVPLPMGASYASPCSHRSDRSGGPDRGNPGPQGGATGRHPGAQLPAARGPGRGRRRRRFAPHGATGDRAGRAGARHLRRALHGRDGGDREPREARADPRSRRGVLARRHNPAGRRARLARHPPGRPGGRVRELQRGGESGGGVLLHLRERRGGGPVLPPDVPVLFVPDFFLGSHVRRITGRPIEVWMGECHVHAALGPADVEAKRREYPDAEFLVHPECGCVTGTMYYAAADGDVAAGRTHIVSTEAMTRRARISPARRFVVATETGVLYR